MFSKINKKTVITIVVSTALLLAPYAVMAFAAVGGSDTSNCESFKGQFGGLFNWVDCASYANGNLLIYKIIQLLLGLAGGVAVLFIIIGGFWYITSAGNEEQAEKGRKTLTNSIIGLVVIVLAATIIRIVVNTVTGGATGTSSSSGNTTNNSNTTAGNTTSGGNNSGNNNTGGNNAPDIQSLAGSVSMEPAQPVQGDKINFTINIPTANYAQVQAACGGGSVTFVAQLVNSGAQHSVNFSPTTSSGYLASISFSASEIKATNETANFAICNTGLPSQQINFQVGQNFQPVN